MSFHQIIDVQPTQQTNPQYLVGKAANIQTNIEINNNKNIINSTTTTTACTLILQNDEKDIITVKNIYSKILSNDVESTSTIQKTLGTLVISTQRILFYAYPTTMGGTTTSTDDNMSIDASLICIHALQEEGDQTDNDDDDDEDDDNDNNEVEKCIYLQLLTTSLNDEQTPIEILFIPQKQTDFTENNQLLQKLFQALSKTAELNPPLDDDDDDDNDGGEMCFTSSGGVTNWDDLLVESEHYEEGVMEYSDEVVVDGQFDDASEEDN